ncbi:MAG TPA: phosphoenolpyruvate--protein phosphotransferase [Candidatus Angelobacter sp.]|nr:phosphoenolpyruvate--protein phosphotransferase [Candidatus Angelobacter sp.]
MTQIASMAPEFKFSCPLPHGLHARPASQLSTLASGFLSACVLTNLRNGATANMKSVLSIIAADVRLDDECSITVQGADEVMARKALQRFVSHELPRCDTPLQERPRDKSKVARNVPRILLSAGVEICPGVPVSHGIADGAVVMIENSVLRAEAGRESATNAEEERKQVSRAMIAVQARIHALIEHRTSAVETGVLQAHLALLGDVSLSDSIMERIAEGRSAGQAIVEVSQHYRELIHKVESPYIRERAIDIQEICSELLEEIYGRRQTAVQLRVPSVVVADNLAPQRLLALDRKWLTALVLEAAGVTSHTVILARSMGIPTLVGVTDPLHTLSAGEVVIVDANRGFLVRHSTPAARRFYQGQTGALERRKTALARHAGETAVTADGRPLEVGANISSAAEPDIVFGNGADGIGLFRTEMLFLSRDSAPNEQEQFEVYAQVARAAGDRPVIIRTLDIGGDKQVDWLNLPQEDNPFLGYRGVRIYPDHQQIVDDQFRAIVRASALGRIQMMVPMISSMEEVRWYKTRLAQIQSELASEKIEFNPKMPVGVMIEIPSAAFMIDQMAKELDFFSIGTNDLSQYFLAVDRDNPRVAALSNVAQPAFLRFLRHIIDEVHRAGKWVGICGEMAGDLRYLPLLLGMGPDEISLSGHDIPVVKERIARYAAAECRILLAQAMDCQTAAEVEALLSANAPNGSSRTLLNRELILLESKSESKEEAIREMVDAFYADGRTDDPDRLEQSLWAREEVYSTGLGFGFAIPHAKTNAVNSSSVGVLKLKQPVEWGSLDGKPVEMMIVLAARESDPGSSQMQVFSKLARKLMDEEFRAELLNVKDTDALLTFFAGQLGIKA